MNEPEDGQGRKRCRAACGSCRRRKRKCDGKTPCGACVRYEYHCRYMSSKCHSAHRPDNPDSAKLIDRGSSWSATNDSSLSVTWPRFKTLTAPGAWYHHRSILDPVETHFVRACSAIAFPRILALDMESDTVPRLHEYGWCIGIRQEDQDPHFDISTVLAWNDMQRLAKIYFAVVKPELGLLDEADFLKRARSRYAHEVGCNDFDSIILMVTALGSFFSPNPLLNEAEFVRMAKSHVTFRRTSIGPSLATTVTWTLIAIYMRCTGRPHGSWLASSIAMHQAEACGLHREMRTIAIVYPVASTTDWRLMKARRKIYWVARALNIIFSFEYGRSSVKFDVITIKKPATDIGGNAHVLVRLAEMLPNDDLDCETEQDPPAALSHALTCVLEVVTESSFVTLLKADMAFAIYRRLWLMSLTDAKDRAESLLDIGSIALEASRTLLESQRPWWNVLHVPFQFVNIALSINTCNSLTYIPDAMALLQQIEDSYPTQMVREANKQAMTMVHISGSRKHDELEALQTLPEMSARRNSPNINSNHRTDQNIEVRSNCNTALHSGRMTFVHNN